MAKKQRIIKNGYVAVVSKDKVATAEFDDYVYEHRQVAEEMLDRPLKEGEEVHHLDLNKTNNSPDNLLVLSGPMHAKLHTWLNKNTITPTPEYQVRKNLGCIRCLTCEKPIDHTEKYCSTDCQNIGRRKVDRPTKEQLIEQMNTMSLVKIGQKHKVSDNAVRKWAKGYKII